MVGYTKFDLPDSVAKAFIHGELTEVGGFAGLVIDRGMAAPFAIAPKDATAEQLCAFNAGKRWKQEPSDEALIAALATWPQPWWAMCQPAWVKRGDLADDDWLGEHFYFQDQILIHANQPNFLNPENWRNNSIAFLAIIYVLRGDYSGKTPPRAADLSAEQAKAMADNVIAVILNAYDDESWIGYSVTPA